nr:hypothetical protein Iba_chr06cCG10760 [Ipomoea batatas]GME07509.1 hypothetical protein Iba_scaffold6213CG0010 [Ipomoea batatas]
MTTVILCLAEEEEQGSPLQAAAATFVPLRRRRLPPPSSVHHPATLFERIRVVRQHAPPPPNGRRVTAKTFRRRELTISVRYLCQKQRRRRLAGRGSCNTAGFRRCLTTAPAVIVHTRSAVAVNRDRRWNKDRRRRCSASLPQLPTSSTATAHQHHGHTRTVGKGWTGKLPPRPPPPMLPVCFVQAARKGERPRVQVLLSLDCLYDRRAATPTLGAALHRRRDEEHWDDGGCRPRRSFLHSSFVGRGSPSVD